MKIWKSLTNRGKVILGITIIITITICFLFPIAWHIATTDTPNHEPYVFKECPTDVYNAFSFDNTSFTINKKIWFCRDEKVPVKTQIYHGGKAIEPAEETSDSVTYAIDFLSLRGDWKLIAQNSEWTLTELE